MLLFPTLLARLGLVDERKGRKTFGLAMPVMVTGGVRVVLRFTDFFMVSLVLGDAAIAGLEMGFQYYFIGFGIALGLSGGTISTVSRFIGAGEREKASFSILQSFWLALLISVPLTTVCYLYPEALIGVLSQNSATVRQGGIYLRIIMISVTCRFWNMIAARALAGAGNTETPMFVRLFTVPTNIVLNAFFIFGIWPFPTLGVGGAALGTTLADTAGAIIFLHLLMSGKYGLRLKIGEKLWDQSVAGEIIRVGSQLSVTYLIRTLARFPFLFILSTIGTPVVAAYAIGRRVMLLALMPAWGYSTSASTLVGQHVGEGNIDEATSYGWETLRIALVTQLFIGGILVALASPITALFQPGSPDLVVNFIRVFGIGVAGFSISRTLKGALTGAGDTFIPMVGTISGTVLKLLLGFLALPAGMTLFHLFSFPVQPGLGLGITIIYAGIIQDMYLRAIVNILRFWSGRWTSIGTPEKAPTVTQSKT